MHIDALPAYLHNYTMFVFQTREPGNETRYTCYKSFSIFINMVVVLDIHCIKSIYTHSHNYYGNHYHDN